MNCKLVFKYLVVLENELKEKLISGVSFYTLTC